MISENSHYALRNRSGRYLVRRLHIPTYPGRGGCHIPGEPSRWIYSLTPNPLDADTARNIPALMQMIVEYYWNRDEWFVAKAPVCACCGSPYVQRRAGGSSPYRCAKHLEWNPCVIEGCTRVRSAAGTDGVIRLADNQVICAEHWRRYVPPRSRLRRLYHRHFRRAKQLGWNDDRLASFYAFWNRLVARVRARATSGHVDEAEINRLFGWD